ncbi:MAG TPA: hypothetical protein VEQ15_00325 [Myxococcales bacterium]|nr:hypothetical protein [Myxococcales bacterium]
MALDTTLGTLLVEAASSLDPGGKYARFYAIASPSAGPLAAGAVALADTARTTAGASIAGTLAGAAGKTTFVRGFRITAPPIAVAVSGQVTLSGLASGKTFSYEFAALVGALAQLGEDFGDGLAANAANTAIVLTVPALALATVSLDIWGYQL